MFKMIKLAEVLKFVQNASSRRGIPKDFADAALVVLVVLGAIWAFVALSDFLGGVVDVVSACFPSRPKTKKLGEWAIVTGGSDGIGKGLATELSKAGSRVVIIARNKEKLDAARKDILEASKAKPEDVRVVVADFGREDSTALYAGLEKDLKDVIGSVGVLVNNVGVSYPGALRFEELSQEACGGSAERTRAMINVNVLSAVKMTEMVLGGMKERRKGAVLFVSSAHGRMPVGAPLYAEYGGCKAFIETFAKSIAHECEGSGVAVQVQFPYFVATKMAKIRKPTLFSPSPNAFARSMLAALSSGEVKSVPHWSHKIQDSIALALPNWLLKLGVMQMHNGLRAAYLKKLKRKAKTE